MARTFDKDIANTLEADLPEDYGNKHNERLTYAVYSKDAKKRFLNVIRTFANNREDSDRQEFISKVFRVKPPLFSLILRGGKGYQLSSKDRKIILERISEKYGEETAHKIIYATTKEVSDADLDKHAEYVRRDLKNKAYTAYLETDIPSAELPEIKDPYLAEILADKQRWYPLVNSINIIADLYSQEGQCFFTAIDADKSHFGLFKAAVFVSAMLDTKQITPSAMTAETVKLLNKIEDRFGNSYVQCILVLSKTHKKALIDTFVTAINGMDGDKIEQTPTAAETLPRNLDVKRMMQMIADLDPKKLPAAQKVFKTAIEAGDPTIAEALLDLLGPEI